ncbi:MAG: relaxase domain-containing protein, partial [Bifidobacteriaceae bacterium]|nr:relaxase domain-containing protein [Bifidobacteriaceae bacterium]
MKGGVVLFRGSGGAARRYVEAGRCRADDYYLGGGDAVALHTVVDGAGATIARRALDADGYEAWVNWFDPATGESIGKPRKAGDGRRGSPLFAEMVINAPKSLSVASALHPDVSAALDMAQCDAAVEIRRWLGSHSVTRVGPRGAQEVVPVERLQTVAITHRASRAGDPHRHIHFQIGTRVRAAGAWRALDTAALFKQQGAIRTLGAAVIAGHPGLAETLAAHGLTLDHATGEVVELEGFNAVLSKRSTQVHRNLAQMTADWEEAHPGETPGPALTARIQAQAWAKDRPSKKPANADLRDEAWWVRELQDAGYDPRSLVGRAARPARPLGELSARVVASRALDRCAANQSAWTRHTIQENATRLVTEAGVGVALVGDRAQLPAVGRGGVLDMAASIRGQVIDMAGLHRFADPGYAELTLAMRDGQDPGAVFDQLRSLGLVRLHSDEDAMRERVAAEAREGEAVTVTTNDEATSLNERVRARQVTEGLVDDTRTVTGSDGLEMGAGDVVQTRLNANRLGVANRQTWVVQQVTEDGSVCVREAGGGRRAPRTAVLPPEYAREHTHLAYAATAYGVQGATVNQAHTILTDQASGAGLYVGMTRGRQTNLLHIAADNWADAREQYVEAAARDRADRGLDHAARQAAEAVNGLVADGPARLVQAEIARLTGIAEDAEQAAVRWAQAAARVHARHAAQAAEQARRLQIPWEPTRPVPPPTTPPPAT